MADTPKYDDSKSGGYSYAEKLSMVAKGLMDPKDIGMTSPDDAIYEITGLKKPDPKPWLADFVAFECSVIPLEIQAKWARQDLKVIPPNPKSWEADWIDEHQGQHRVQAKFTCGSLQGMMDQTFTDPVYGMTELMRQAVELLKQKYEELKQENPEAYYKTRAQIEAERREAAAGR